MHVRANQEYIFYPNLLDRNDGRTNLVPGSIVKVVNLPGCPKANTMQHATSNSKADLWVWFTLTLCTR